jgi:hypothetical protein
MGAEIRESSWHMTGAGAAPKTRKPPSTENLKPDDGGGTFGDMDGRVTRLEEQMAGVREDLRDIKSDLKILPTLATKRDIGTYLATTATLSFAVVAIIIGGLGWLETRASRVTSPPPAAAPQPIIIESPQAAPPQPKRH